MAITLDTLAYARRLREAGFSEQQAEGQAQALAAAMTDTLATKQDLSELALRLEVRFEKIDSRFAGIDARFAQVDARFDGLEKHLDTQLAELEARNVIRLADQENRTALRLTEFEKRSELRLREVTSDLERRLTMRMGGIMVAGMTVLSLLVTMF